MTASNVSLLETAVPDHFEEVDRVLAARVSEALWQAQVQQIQSQEWFNFAADGYLLTDMHGVIHETNYATVAFLETRKEFLLGKPLGLLMTPENQRRFYQHLVRLAIFGGVEHWETRIWRPNGRARDVMLTATAISDEHGQRARLRWMLHDVSEARQAERARLAEKNLAECLLESVDILIFLVDEFGTILRCNSYALAITGYDANELQGRNWSHILLPEKQREAGRRLLHEARTGGAGRSDLLDLAVRGGQNRRVRWSARKLGQQVLLFGQDVTDLHEAQRQAVKSERLATIGQMSATLVHEGRNALQRIQACLSLLTLRLKDQPDNLDLLSRIQKAEDDLQRLFEDVGTFAITTRLHPRWCDLRLCWREAWNDIGSLRPSAELREDTGGINLFCQVDPFYLKQVFRNLLENALASGANPVHIDIRCRPAVLNGEEAICIHLRDNGPGFAVEARSHLFEPFCTTKARGTGLGLAICKRILEAHGGRIEANDHSDSGAELIITLPGGGVDHERTSNGAAHRRR
ncbi:MAG TPA: ATP-binding protein [Gemmataceae bacterium]|nr:ATP-binding protein [Gemmataceae bacterium]